MELWTSVDCEWWMMAHRLLLELVEQESVYALLLPPLLSLLASDVAVKLLVMLRTALWQPPPPRVWCETCFSSRRAATPHIQVTIPACCFPTCSHHPSKECIMSGSLSNGFLYLFTVQGDHWVQGWKNQQLSHWWWRENCIVCPHLQVTCHGPLGPRHLFDSCPWQTHTWWPPSTRPCAVSRGNWLQDGL